MRFKGIIILLVSLLFAAACTKPDTTQPASAAQSPTPQTTASNTANTVAQTQQKTEATGREAEPKTKLNACTLIASNELRDIQGEAVKETTLSQRFKDSLYIQQCLYQLPTFSKSLSLELTQPDPSKGASVNLKKMWEARFSKGEEAERDKKDGAKGVERGGKGEEESESMRVEGVGEEAFWVGNRVLGALYIYSKNSIIRLSLGGPEDIQAKIKKLKTLAQNVINRL